MNERAEGAIAGDAASTRIQVSAERELAMAFMGSVTAKSSIYRHKAYSCIVSTLTGNVN